MTELSKSEYAQARGCSPAYVSKLARQGRLVLTKAGKVNVEATDRLIESTRDPARGGDRRPGAAERAESGAAAGQDGQRTVGHQTYKEAARRERIAKARIAELVRKEEVAAAIFGLSRRAMGALAALADRLASQLAAESDVARVHALLTEHTTKIRVAMLGALPGLPEAMERVA